MKSISKEQFIEIEKILNYNEDIFIYINTGNYNFITAKVYSILDTSIIFHLVFNHQANIYQWGMENLEFVIYDEACFKFLSTAAKRIITDNLNLFR